ncbi:MAG: phospholipase/carboxylesterase [Paraglaciecola psychrophila]|jgi:phospholipase/carboxylesterase
MTYLPCETVETGNNADAAVIWLHGLGANGHDFVPIVPQLRLPATLNVRFIFPHAPSIPVTINGGMVMPAWYDILSLEGGRKTSPDQIEASAAAVIELVERERSRGIASERIVLAGFSQGGAVVYQAALAYHNRLAGLMTMSTYFPTHETVQASAANAALPIHIFHGDQDQMVTLSMGQHALDTLKGMGHEPAFKTYAMGHEVHPQEIDDISAWLQQILAQ